MNSSDPETAKWRRAQWIVILAWILVFAILGVLDIANWDKNKRTPLGCAMGFLTAFAHGAWITLDLKALNRPVGGWRFAAFFLGPLTVWFYLALTYRIRALWMIPCSFFIYLAPFGMMFLAKVLMGGLPPW